MASRARMKITSYCLKPHLTKDSAVVVNGVYPAPLITGNKVRSQYFYWRT